MMRRDVFSRDCLAKGICINFNSSPRWENFTEKNEINSYLLVSESLRPVVWISYNRTALFWFFFTFLTLKTQDFSYVFFIQNSEEIVRVTIAVSKFTSRGMKVHGYEVVRLTPDYVRYIFVKVVVAFPHCCFSWPNFAMIVPNFTERMLNINWAFIKMSDRWKYRLFYQTRLYQSLKIRYKLGESRVRRQSKAKTDLY